MQVLAQVHIDYKQQIQDSNPDLAGKKLCLKRPPLNTGVTTKDGREARAQRSFRKWQSKQPEVETHQERGPFDPGPSASSLGHQGAVVREEVGGTHKPGRADRT